MIDRGFVKRRPFESLIPSKEVFREIDEQQVFQKPTLFPEEISFLSEEIMDAYYSKDSIVLTFYEAGKIREIQSTIKKIHPNSKTIELGCGKILSFRQILHITSSS